MGVSANLLKKKKNYQKSILEDFDKCFKSLSDVSFNLNKWFPRIFNVFLYVFFSFFSDFVVWLLCCVVLFVVLYGVVLILHLVAMFVCLYWKIGFSQSQIQSMIWMSTLQIRKHVYFDDLNFIILFVAILPLYAINLCAVNLFVDSSFMFLAILILIYYINLNEWISFLFSTKKIFST